MILVEKKYLAKINFMWEIIARNINKISSRTLTPKQALDCVIFTKILEIEYSKMKN